MACPPNCSWAAKENPKHRFIDANQNGQLDAGDTDITKYNWDHRNRLYKVQHQASYGAAVDWVIRYSYDYENRLVRRRMDANGDGDYEQKRVFVYDGNQVVLDFQHTGAGDVAASDLRQRYLWGPAVDQILAEEEVDGGTADLVQWTLTDHLNTVRDIAKYDPGTDTITVVNHLVYDAFGNVTSETDPTVDSLFLYTARPFDEDTGLQNNLNRWYDPAVGRWLSQDPIGFAGGDGNLYRYVDNSPTLSVDPTGKNRWVMTNGLHWWIVVEEWDATGTNVIGYHKLEYWVYGYEINFWGVRPSDPNIGDCLDNGGFIVGEWKSNAVQDQALVDEWRKLSDDRNRRCPIVYYLGYFLGFNCESISLLWCNYGGSAGPATLITPPPRRVPRLEH